ncbi:MAG: zinc-binding dehydrogenase [Chloroflexota bacterium]
MKALVFQGAGQMTLEERPDPVPGPAEVVVAVRAAGICGSDVHGYLGATGRRRPGVAMGHEAAGDVLALGAGVDGVREGDRVALRSILSCGHCPECTAGRPNICVNRRGLGMHLEGAYAEKVLVPATLAVRLPPDVPYEEAALIEPLAVAMHAMSLSPPEPGDTVAIVGAGAIGLLTLLAVRLTNVSCIVVTDRDRHRLDVARQLGADVVVDVDANDPVAAVGAATEGRGADVVFEAVGVAAAAAQSTAVARSGGRITWIGNSAPTVELSMQEVVTRELVLRGAYGFRDEFEQAAEAIATRRIDVRPLIELTAPLSEGPELFRRLGAREIDAVKVVLEPGG